jgi:hypothetical protein
MAPSSNNRPPFSGSIFPKTQAQLNAVSNRDAVSLLTRIAVHHECESVIDRLLVLLYPEHLDQMLRYYSSITPALSEVLSKDELLKIDAALAAMVPVLTNLFPEIIIEAQEPNKDVNSVARDKIEVIATAAAVAAERSTRSTTRK